MTRRGLRWADYYAREECMVANAVPTAEGKRGQDTKYGFLSPLDSPYLPLR